MRRLASLSVALALSLGLGACGSITRGTKEDVAINVTPSIADIRTSNGSVCQGSCTLKVPRNEEFTVTASAAGYRTEVVEVKTKLAGAGAASMAGNVLAGGVIGIGIDAATGASLDHTPNPVTIVLQPEGQPAAATKPAAGETAKRKGVPVS